MGLLRTDNDKRRARLSELIGHILNDGNSIAKSGKDIVSHLKEIDLTLAELSKRPGFVCSKELPPFSEHLIPSFAIPGTPTTKTTLMYLIQTIQVLGTGAGTGYVIGRLLQPWVRTAIDSYVVGAALANVGPRQAFHFTAEEMTTIEGSLGSWARIGGARGVTRGLAAFAGGAAAAALIWLATEAIFDELEYDKLMAALQEALPTRYISAYNASRMEALATVFLTASLTLKIYAKQKIPLNADLFASDVAKSISDEFSVDISNTVLEKLQNMDRESGSYTQSDVSKEVLLAALRKSIEDQPKKFEGVIEEITVSSGWVVDSLQSKPAGKSADMRWGGAGGSTSKVSIPDGRITSLSWQPAIFNGENCLYNLVIKTPTTTSQAFGAPSSNSGVQDKGKRVEVTIPDGWRVKKFIGSDKIDVAIQTGGNATIQQTPYVRDIYAVIEPIPK